MKGKIIELGCEWGCEDFRNHVIWVRTGVLLSWRRVDLGSHHSPLQEDHPLEEGEYGRLDCKLHTYTGLYPVLEKHGFAFWGVGVGFFIILPFTRYQPPSLPS